MTHFLTTPKFDLLLYRGEVPADTFAKLPVRALINDPKKLFQKKVYVTIPQWFETFPNVSDFRSGRNRAKCGLALNDPIDWFKLRLNQPKTNLWYLLKSFLQQFLKQREHINFWVLKTIMRFDVALITHRSICYGVFIPTLVFTCVCVLCAYKIWEFTDMCMAKCGW